MTRISLDKEKSGGGVNKCVKGKDKTKRRGKEIESTMTRLPLDKDDEE